MNKKLTCWLATMLIASSLLLPLTSRADEHPVVVGNSDNGEFTLSAEERNEVSQQSNAIPFSTIVSIDDWDSWSRVAVQGDSANNNDELESLVLRECLRDENNHAGFFLHREGDEPAVAVVVNSRKHLIAVVARPGSRVTQEQAHRARVAAEPFMARGENARAILTALKNLMPGEDQASGNAKYDAKVANRLYDEGKALYTRGAYKAAIAKYTQALAITEKTPSAALATGDFLGKSVIWCGRGWAYLGNKQYSLALTDFDRAIKGTPEEQYDQVLTSGAYYGKACVLFAKHDYSGALRYAPKNTADGQDLRRRIFILLGENERQKAREGGYNVASLAAQGNWPRLKALLAEAPSQIRDVDSSGREALHYAVQAGRLDMISFLISKRASVNAVSRSAYRVTPLRIAILNKNYAVATLLLNKGANPFSTENGQTMLHTAVAKADYKMISLLISKGLNINTSAPDGSGTPLFTAVSSGNINLTNLLISKGAKVNVRNGRKSTPLHEAVRINSKLMARLLKSKGADLRAEDVEGYTPSELAVLQHNPVIADMLKP